MTIRVPNTLTADNSEKYEVSIRLWPGGLSFSGYIPQEKESFFTETVLLDSDQLMAQSLKDIFFENQCFSYVYRSLYVICVSGKYTFVPENVFSEKDKGSLFSFCYQDGCGKALAQPLANLQSVLLFDVDNDVYEFLMRSLVSPRFIHSVSPLLISWQKKSLSSYPKQVYVYIHDEILDVACFERGEMLFASSFNYENDSDIVYYIMYTCRQLGINQLGDGLHFCGDNDACRSVISVISNYIKQADYLPMQMDDYIVEADKEVYMDVVALTECVL